MRSRSQTTSFSGYCVCSRHHDGHCLIMAGAVFFPIWLAAWPMKHYLSDSMCDPVRRESAPTMALCCLTTPVSCQLEYGGRSWSWHQLAVWYSGT
jgi:hypothetical protein